MTNEVGRQRGGRESRAPNSARREANTGRSKRKGAVGSSSEAQHEPEAQPKPQAQHELEAQHEAEVEQEMDAKQDADELDAEIEAEHEAEVHEPPPPPPKPRKRNRRTTTRRNPPPVAEPPVTGFGGGPTDLSLLPSFGKHVAAALWRGECGSRYLKCMNNGKKIKVLDKPNSNLLWFWNAVEASGLRPLLKTNYNHVGWGLLTAFTERWHPETGTFHLPIGEMTITLDDVSCLLHIPISGKMLNHLGTSCTMEEGKYMCDEFLNFNIEECKEEFDKMKGAHIGFPKLQDIYHNNLNQALEAENNQEAPEVVEFFRECTIRAFLLYLIGATLFTNKSAQYVDVIFLTYLQDIKLVNTWNWGASGLAYLYNYLDYASRPKCGNHGGYNCLFQAWIMVHFKRFGMHFLEDNYTHQDPVAAKFYPLKSGKIPYETRTALDRMEVDEVTFCPYEDHRHTRPFEDISWYSGWIMCGSTMICPHLPERVLRQYGHVQSIPRAPDVSAKASMNRFSIAEAFNDYLTDNYVTETIRGPRAQHGFETDPGYIAWFYRVSHPKIWPPIQGNPPRPANLEVMIEEDNANTKCDVFEICKTVRAEVREKLDSDLTLEAARELLEKVYSNLELVPTYYVHRKRKRHSGEGKKKRKKTRSRETDPSH